MTTENVLSSEQRHILLLWQRVNTSLSAFYKLTNACKTASGALQAPSTQWAKLGIHTKHIERHKNADIKQDTAFINSITDKVINKEFEILFSTHKSYPAQLLQLFDPPPLLFYRGNLNLLHQPQIAIVGSRKPTSQAQKFTFDMAQYLANAGYVITSGLAQGVDAQAHLGALSQTFSNDGRTVGVMGTGINVCYPKQNQPLFDRIINEGGCLVSELLPGTPPNKHTFPRRNRLVAGLSLGTIVTEAAIKSGSLITARLTSEQGKQVFALPSSIDNINAEGCHYLIREGATLVYHPDQVIDELSNQINPKPFIATNKRVLFEPTNQDARSEETSTYSELNNTVSLTASIEQRVNPNEVFKEVSKPSTSVSIPDHLQVLWVQLDFNGLDLDALVTKSGLDTPQLLSQLMELELMGVVSQIGGRYKRL